MTQHTPDRERILKTLQEEAKRLVDEKTREILLDYHMTFTSPHGQRVLADLIASYSGNSFTPGYPDVTAFREGRRSVPDDIRVILHRAEAFGVTTPASTPREQA